MGPSIFPLISDIPFRLKFPISFEILKDAWMPDIKIRREKGEAGAIDAYFTFFKNYNYLKAFICKIESS